MPDDNVERVRAGFAAQNRGDLDALLTIRDGRCVREQACRNRDEALEAADVAAD